MVRTRPRPHAATVAVAALGLAALTGGCGADQDPVVAGPEATTTAPERATTTTSAAATGGLATTTVTAPGAGRGLLENVQATAAGDVDRVTFTFEGDVPGYRVGYVARPVVEDGSGTEVTIDGEAVLEVRFEPASGFDLTGEGRQVYRGPTRLDLATRSVLDVVRVGDFEAVLTWAIGVDTEAPFRVRTEGGNRIVVEVAAPAGD